MSHDDTTPDIPDGSATSGGRIPVDQSAAIAAAFLTGSLRWASDLVHGDVILASTPAPASAPAPTSGAGRGRTVQVTVGDVACAVADAMARRRPTA